MKLFLFILDGCSVSEFKDANTPFIDEASEAGLSTECEAVFPTATYTGHSSIITGNYPEKHGMVGNQFWDRHHKCIRNFDDFNPNENIKSPTIFEILPFDTCSICEPVSKGASVVVKKKFFDKIPVEKQNYSIFHALKTSLSPNIQFYVINFQGVDGFGENLGPKSSEYLGVLEECDELISNLKDKIKSDFVFMITADHGMTPVKKNIDLKEDLNSEGFQARCLASHRTSHIYAESNLEELEKYLRGLPYVDKVFNLPDIERIHLTHERTGDLVVSAKKGFEFGNKKLKGSHGGATRDEMLVPFIIYSSESKVIENISLESMKLVDICPTILDLYKIRPNFHFQGKSLYKMH